MRENFNILMAMSGGVDSSVAAALLKEQGHQVTGVTMNLACVTSSSDRSCCSMSAAQDAKKVADQLGILHYILNFKEEFKKEIIDNFIHEYKMGRTPNPCVRCNQLIKFDLLLRKAKELDCEFVATGHYARINFQPPTSNLQIMTKYQLLKGTDAKKDQSYVLYRLTQEQLAHTLFPLGEMTKEEVRKKAKELKLPVADKEESQEICFIEDDDYQRFIREKAPELVRPGKILDLSGKEVGKHEGVAFYTVGQRRGVGAHRGLPKYVVRIDAVNNTVVIGDDKDLLRSELYAEDLSFISGQEPTGSMDITAKIRYNAAEVGARLSVEHGAQNTEHRAQVKFVEPQRAVTPGQSVVFYKGEEVLGGGIICL